MILMMKDLKLLHYHFMKTDQFDWWVKAEYVDMNNLSYRVSNDCKLEGCPYTKWRQTCILPFCKESQWMVEIWSQTTRIRLIHT